MPPVGRGDAREPERLGERNDRGIDEPELEIVKAPVQVRHTPVRLLGQIRNEVISPPGLPPPARPCRLDHSQRRLRLAAPAAARG